MEVTLDHGKRPSSMVESGPKPASVILGAALMEN
jgi:hypothetical protein